MDKIKKFVKSNKLPFLILFLVMLFISYFKLMINDDIYFSDFANMTGKARLLWFLEWRFEAATSRIIIEAVLVLFTRDFFWLWKILDPMVYVVLAYGIYKVFIIKNEKSRTICSILVCLILCIPQKILNSAGWVATSLNYLWPTAFGVLSLLPIRKCLEDKPIKWFEMPIYLASIVFAGNTEQVAVVLFTVFLIFTIYLSIKRKIKPIIVVMFVLSIANLILVLVNPGNARRTMAEVFTNFVDYRMINLLDKALIGIYTVMQYFVMHFSAIYVILTVTMLTQIWKKYDNVFYRIIAVFPVFMGLAFNIGGNVSAHIFPYLRDAFSMNFTEELKILINFENFDDLTAYLPIFCCILNLGCLITSTYLIFRKNNGYIIPLLVLCAGICSKFIIGFVVTVFISGYRTQFIWITAMIIVTAMVLDQKSEKELKNISNLLIIFAIVTVINHLCLCVNTY